jgi:hypothetical protein
MRKGLRIEIPDVMSIDMHTKGTHMPLTPDAQQAADLLTKQCETLFALITQSPETSDALAQQVEAMLLDAQAMGVCPRVIIGRLRARLTALLQHAARRLPSLPRVRLRHG